MTDFELFLTQLGFLPKPQPVVAKVVSAPTNNDWFKQGKECPF